MAFKLDLTCIEIKIVHTISAQYVKACRRKVWKSDGLTEEDTDGLRHNMIYPD